MVEVSSLGQPRQIRASVTRLNEIRRELPGAHPVAAAVYIGPQSARILKSNGLGFVDLSGNCYLAFENVLIEKEGKRNVRPSTRPLRSLFAPRATRVVRVLLIEPARAWRLEELGKAAGVSPRPLVQRRQAARGARVGGARCGPAHPPVEAGRPARGVVRVVHVPRERDHVVPGAGARDAEVHGGDRPRRVRERGVPTPSRSTRARRSWCRASGCRPSTATSRAIPRRSRRPSACARRRRPDGTLHILEPYDPGVLYGALREKAGSRSCVCPSSTPTSSTTSAADRSRPSMCGAKP